MSKLRFSEKYEKFNKIGEGCISVVYKGQDKLTKEFVAIKEAPINEFNNFRKEIDVEKEVKFFKIFNYCPNSVKLYESLKDNNIIYLIMELCDANLLQILKKSKKGFSVYEVKIIMKQLNNILKEIRKKDMIHNDCKLENILIKFKENSKEFEIKLSDYGGAKIVSTTKDLSNNEWGIEPYKGTTEESEAILKLDLLRLGLDIYTMLFKKSYKSYNDMIKKIEKFIQDEDLKDLLKKLFVEDSRERIGWDEYFNHSFFNIDNFDFNKVENVVKSNDI
jgi:serine/threonine protein kinase